MKRGRPRESLFPLPRNRKREPTDAEALLHAVCVAIRDHGTHAELRKLISHLPRIMNRVSPFTATQAHVAALQFRVGELEAVLRKMIPRLKRQTKRDIAVAAQLSTPDDDTSDITPAVAQADAQSDAGERMSAEEKANEEGTTKQ